MSEGDGQEGDHTGINQGVGGGKKELYQKYENKIRRERLGKALPKHPKFGQLLPLDRNNIPTFGNIVSAILHKQSDIRLEHNLKQNPSNFQVLEEISKE